MANEGEEEQGQSTKTLSSSQQQSDAALLLQYEEYFNNATAFALNYNLNIVKNELVPQLEDLSKRQSNSTGFPEAGQGASGKVAIQDKNAECELWRDIANAASKAANLRLKMAQELAQGPTKEVEQGGQELAKDPTEEVESVLQGLKEHREAAQKYKVYASDAVTQLQRLEKVAKQDGAALKKALAVKEKAEEKEEGSKIRLGDSDDLQSYRAAQELKDKISRALDEAKTSEARAKKASQEAKKQESMFIKKAIKAQKKNLDGVLKVMEKALEDGLKKVLQEAGIESPPAYNPYALPADPPPYNPDALPAPTPAYAPPTTPAADPPAYSPSVNDKENIAVKSNNLSRTLRPNPEQSPDFYAEIRKRNAIRDALIKVLNEYEKDILKHITRADYDKAIDKAQKNLDSSPMVAFYRFAEYVSTKEESKTKWREKADKARLQAINKEISKNVKEVVTTQENDSTKLSHRERLLNERKMELIRGKGV